MAVISFASSPLVSDLPVIVGAGLAGISAALALAPRPCVVLAASPLGAGTSTGWAQGGIAAAVGADDAASLHLADTIAAADGLADPDAARAILEAGPDAIARLASFGVRFDRDASGGLRLGLEAAHGRRRIVHADGDGTGREVLRALVDAVRRTRSITVLEGLSARRLLLDGNGGIAGLVAVREQTGETVTLRTRAVVLATGGMGALWPHTTNPTGARGHGVALAARAGAALAELEFVQFHPTAIDVGRDPMPLASEAIRGEGAHLVDGTDTRFMLDCEAARGRAELAPRDVVARAVAARIEAGHRVFLDTPGAIGSGFAARFPAVHALCREAGIDPAVTPIPVRPALHYAMGGVAVDADGRSTVDGLFAIGEAAATGLHGANRLASNSLLEAAVTGERVGRLLREATAAPAGRARALGLPPQGGEVAAIRRAMGSGFGVLRDEAGMRDAAASLEALRADPSVDALALDTARLVAASALARAESRGAHARTDHTSRDAVARRRTMTLAQADAALAALRAIPPRRERA